MFEDDDMFLNNDEINSENQLTIAEEAAIKVLDSIEQTAQEMKYNLKFHEGNSFEVNAERLDKLVGILVSLRDESELSVEEQEERILNALKASTPLTLSNMNDFVKEDNTSTPSFTINDDENNDDDDDDLF